MSIWSTFKIKNHTKESKVSLRRVVTSVLNTRTGGEFSISRESDEFGYYHVSMCDYGTHAFDSIQSIIYLCKTYDDRSNIEIEVTRLLMY